MNAEHLLTHFDRIADAPDAIPRLRRFVLDLTVRGKLMEQDPNDEPASELLRRIAAEKERSIYAELVVQAATVKLLALAENRLGYYKFFAEIGARYRELEKLLPEFEATPERERYMGQNSLFERVRELRSQTMMLPTIWLGELGPPRLEPAGNPMEETIYWAVSH